MIPFDPMQELTPGTTLIEASAGTGKTYTITTLVLRLLLEHGLRVEEILVVTFTEAATAELQHRVRERIRQALQRLESQNPGTDPLLEELAHRFSDPEARAGAIRQLRTALTSFDLAAISTIHGFCRRMLQENAFESGVLFDTELVADQEPLLRELVQDFWTARTHDAAPAFARYLQDAKVSPSSLMDLAWAAADPDLPILPEPEPLDPNAEIQAAQQFQKAYLSFRERWRAEVRDLQVWLKQNEFRGAPSDYWADNLEAHFLEVADYLASDIAHTPHPSLRVFSRQRLMEVFAGARFIPDGSLPDHVELFLAEHERCSLPPKRRLLHLRQELVRVVRSQLPAKKRRLNIQSFDDLLHSLRDALREPEHGPRLQRAIAKRYRAALIDEFQDTDPVQYEIFSSCFARSGGHLFLIGDPKQAIYAFRGADVFAYMRAVDDAGSRAFTLDTNWRSDPSLIGAVNHLFSRPQVPFVFQKIGFLSVKARPKAEDCWGGAALEICHLDRRFFGVHGTKPIPKSRLNHRLPDMVAQDITRMLHRAREGAFPLGDRDLSPGDIAVLVRTNAEASAVEDALRQWGVPSVRQGDASVLDSDEALQLERLMAAVTDPGDRGAVRGALADPLLGMRATELGQLDQGHPEWEAQVEHLREWKQLWESQSFARMFRSVMETWELQTRILVLPGGERRLTNLLHLVELLNSAALEEGLGPIGLLRWLRLEREGTGADASRADARKLRLESDAQAVQIVTIHKSKGLEYPVVFCPYLWSARLTQSWDRSVRFQAEDGRRTLDIGSEHFQANRDRQDLETRAEDMRLLYVALTRARHRCVLYWGPFRNYEHSPLGLLLHQPLGASAGQPGLDAATQHLKGLDDRRMRAELLELAEGSGGRLGVRGPDNAPTAFWQGDGRLDRELDCLVSTHRPDPNWRIGSFSSLAHARQEDALPEHQAGLDHDGQTPPNLALESHEDTPEVLLLPFPRGARAGTFFHHVLELVDFQDTSELPKTSLELLRQHGFSEQWQPLVCEAVEQVLATPFGPDGLCLGGIPRGQRLDEMQFTIPVAEALSVADGASPILSSDLARVLRESGDSGLPEGYAERLAGLPFPELRGFLTGFIDLIFVHQGRWYLVDYKTNHLGDHLGDYQAPRLSPAMAESHYVLQYLLYSVALHRYLTQRLRGYAFEEHFGGCFYLYLKGMTPDTGPSHGVYSHRPNRALVEGLDALFRPGVS